MIQKLIDLICKLFSVLMVASLALMVVMVFGNVVLRYGFNSGLTVSEELSRWLFVWMIFMSALVALRNRAHLGTDMLVSRLPPIGKKLCLGASYLLMLFVCWLMLSGAWQQAVINQQTRSPVLEAPMSWLYYSGVVFAALAILVLLNEMWLLVTGQKSGADLIGVRESEDDVPHAGAQNTASTGKN